ncbi:hypothetical protein J23TS9_04030 [Paenibacillus sp. J23TS9]|nr:hypothetical protein J23TS9_04030 [Paenibacillus sp. J23TS9]
MIFQVLSEYIYVRTGGKAVGIFGSSTKSGRERKAWNKKHGIR